MIQFFFFLSSEAWYIDSFSNISWLIAVSFVPFAGMKPPQGREPIFDRFREYTFDFSQWQG